MQNYIQESERQVRVYGHSSAALPSSVTPPTPNTNSSPSVSSRGLAAIPLLCAAASEQRTAYLRRVQSTQVSNAWWRRQEPLTATPHTLMALPETILLWVAATLEHVALQANDSVLGTAVPKSIAAVLQSALWPLHNTLLAVWMGWILITSVLTSAVEFFKTILLGSRRTGRTLTSIWTDDVVFASNSVHTLVETHQPVSARVVGLVLQPLPVIASVLSFDQPLWVAVLYTMATVATWWYWILLLPWFFTVVMLGTATLLGGCFGLIELAGQV